MYYELYIDIFFLVNFMMDYLLLLLLRKLLSSTATRGNAAFGALLGSLLTCVVMMVPYLSIIVKFVAFHTVINVVMIKVGLKIKGAKKILRAVIMLYIGSVVLGGILTCFRQYVRAGSLFFALAVGSYYVALLVLKVLTYIQKIKQYRCEVVLCNDGHNETFKGLIDTGNSLRDPLSGKPVCIMNRALFEARMGGEKAQVRYCIPYCSVGETNGSIPVVEVDEMYVKSDQLYQVRKPVIGLCQEEITASDEYEMILNPDIL